MKTDISRFNLRLAQRYSGVYQQQGRMITDADWNELVDLLKLRVQEALAEVVGSGAPRRTAPGGQSLPPVTATGRLLPGPLYAGGLRAQLAASAGAAPAGDGSIGLDQQADFPGFTAPGNRRYILYADLWERPVNALEDPSLLDPGLHGADTCTRVQAMAQVKWVENAATDPLAGLPRCGSAELAVALRAATTGTDPCDPCAAEMSLPAAVGNHLFRLEVHDVQGPPAKPTGLTLKWSAENGAESYLADAANGMPPEPFRMKPGHVFEFFSAASEKHLGAHPAVGFKPARLSLAEAYAEPSATDRATLLLGNSIKPWVRRWDGYCKLKNKGAAWVLDFDPAIAVDSKNHAGVDAGQLMPAAAGSPGFAGVQNGTLTLTLGALELKLRLEGQAFLAGDHWLATVRENAEAARRVELASPTPGGIVHQYLRLAEVDATGTTVTVDNTPGGDAGARRLGFPPLTELTADRVGYDPTRKAARWQDILEVANLGQPPAPANLQHALDELVEKLESGDLPYPIPACGAAQTVRKLLLSALADGAASKVKDVLDQLLCGLDASKVPYATSAAQTVREVVDDKVGKTGAQQMQGPLTIQQSLAVQQSATVQQNLSVTVRATVGQFTMAQGATSGWVLTSDAQGNGTWQQPVARGWDIANNNLYTTVTGNVGIGTQVPAARLDVDGGALLGYETSLNAAGMPGDLGAPLKSGFYQNGGAHITGDVPDTTHGWTHLIVARHSNTANNHQLQIAASYAQNDRLFFRKVAVGTSTAANPVWNEVATRGPNTFSGDQTINGAALTVKGKANESAYLGGDGSGIDVQFGSQNTQVPQVHFWNAAGGYWMDIHYRNAIPNSDRRSKCNIRTLKGALEGLRNLRGVTYQWKADATGATQFGLVAQEVQKVFPDLISEARGGLGMNYNGLVAVLVEAVKEQQTQIDGLRKEVDALKAPLAPAAKAKPTPRSR